MNLLDFLFPPRCLGCNQFGTYLCPECTNLFKPLSNHICPVCTKGSFLGATHPHCLSATSLDGLISTFPYTGTAKRAILKFKYQFVSSLTKTLSELMTSFTDFTPIQKNSWLIVPVPLHVKRLRWRGFNQAELLAKSLAAYTHWPYAPGLLKRTRHTTPQMSLRRSARLTNLQGAFAANESLVPSRQPLLLVDDVWTTGSTLKECTKVLKQHGATTVWAITLARA